MADDFIVLFYNRLQSTKWNKQFHIDRMKKNQLCKLRVFLFSYKCECERLGTGYESYETQTALTGYLLKYNVQLFVNRNN